MFARHSYVTLLLLVCLGLGAPPAAAQPVPAALPETAVPETAPQTASANDYVLGPGDVVEAKVLGRSDFDARGRIAADGTIQLPYLGSIRAADRTVSQLTGDIAKALESGGYFSHPIVNIEVVSYASRYVIVLGAVAAPGLVPVDRAYRLSEILARAGGVKDSGADYVILRPESGPEQRYLIETLATGGPTEDPFVAPGEKIYVPPAQLLYISGEVKAPGAYPLTDGMTLRMAIARGGGLTDEGTDRGVKVTHKGATPSQPGLDAKITPGDVIVVGERLF